MLAAKKPIDLEMLALNRGIQRLKQLFAAINLKLRGASPWHLFDFSDKYETDQKATII